MLNSTSQADYNSQIDAPKPIETTSAPITPNPMLAAGLFVIEFKNGNNKCWIESFNEGNPIKTVFLEDAKKYNSFANAEKALKKAIAKNTNGLLGAWIVQLEEKRNSSTKRQEIESKILANKEKISALKKENNNLYYESLLLSDDEQQYFEEEREVVVTKRPKTTKKVLFGIIKWNENFTDEDTGEIVTIQRHQVVKEDGVWVC